MTTFIVKGEKGTDVDVLGTVFAPGDTVELADDVAAPLLEAGTIEAAPAAETPSEPAPAEPAQETPAQPATETPAEQG